MTNLPDTLLLYSRADATCFYSFSEDQYNLFMDWIRGSVTMEQFLGSLSREQEAFFQLWVRRLQALIDHVTIDKARREATEDEPPATP